MAPKFKPLQWIVYKVDNSQYLGQIKSASYITRQGTTEWNYDVKSEGGRIQSVPEQDINFYFENDEYVSAIS